MHAIVTHWESGKAMRHANGEPVQYTLLCRETDLPRGGFTLSGYGAKIPTRYMVQFGARWRRVYAACYGNAATLYIGKPGAWLAIFDYIA